MTGKAFFLAHSIIRRLCQSRLMRPTTFTRWANKNMNCCFFWKGWAKPDQTFFNLWAVSSVDRRILCRWEMPFDGFWVPMGVNELLFSASELWMSGFSTKCSMYFTCEKALVTPLIYSFLLLFFRLFMGYLKKPISDCRIQPLPVLYSTKRRNGESNSFPISENNVLIFLCISVLFFCVRFFWSRENL